MKDYLSGAIQAHWSANTSDSKELLLLTFFASSGFSLILDDRCYANYIIPRTIECLEIPCVLKRHLYHGMILGYRECEGLLYIW